MLKKGSNVTNVANLQLVQGSFQTFHKISTFRSYVSLSFGSDKSKILILAMITCKVWNPARNDPEKQTNHSTDFSGVSGLPFYHVEMGFLEYLRISGEIWYPNGPIGYRKNNLERSLLLLSTIIRACQ